VWDETPEGWWAAVAPIGTVETKRKARGVRSLCPKLCPLFGESLSEQHSQTMRRNHASPRARLLGGALQVPSETSDPNVNPRSAPERVVLTWSESMRGRRPEQPPGRGVGGSSMSKTSASLGDASDDGLRFDIHERRSPIGPRTRQATPRANGLPSRAIAVAAATVEAPAVDGARPVPRRAALRATAPTRGASPGAR